MREIIADSRMMHIGKNGEGDALRVVFQVVAEWEALYGAGGVWTLNVQRHGDALAYAAQDFTIEDGAAVWVVTDADAAVVGEGRCELTYKIGDTVAKSRTYAFRVDRSLTGGGDVPDPVKGWQEALEKRVDGKLDRPDGGSAGDVLTKTGDGEEWKTMQSDWKEFDSSKPGYIKNKPFYTGLENQTYDKVVDMSASKYVDVGVSDFTLYEGTKYTVTWDGKKYESTCESDYGILHIGNFALYDIAPFSKTDTGEPFCVIYDGNTNQIIGEKSGASHHIVMLYGIPTVHMLSPAYIGVKSKSNYMSDDSGRVQYLATPDGNYELVVPEIPNIKNALNGLREKRIATFEMTAEQLDAVSSNEYTEIKTNANIAVSGYNPNNLQSYYVDLLVGGKRYKVLPIDDASSTANFVFETEQFGLPVRTYCIRIENRSYKQKIIRLDQNALNEKKFIFKQQAVADAGKVLTVGDDGKVVPGNISLPPPTPPYTLPTASPTVLGGVKPIAKTDAMTQGVGVDDAGTLWTAAGSGGTDISLGLTSAQVGQIVKVKAVDDNGKPTQWEAGEMTGGGASAAADFTLVGSATLTETASSISITLTKDCDEIIAAYYPYGSAENGSTVVVPFLYINREIWKINRGGMIGVKMASAKMNTDGYVYGYTQVRCKVDGNAVVMEKGEQTSMKVDVGKWNWDGTYMMEFVGYTAKFDDFTTVTSKKIKNVSMQTWNAVFGVGTTLMVWGR